MIDKDCIEKEKLFYEKLHDTYSQALRSLPSGSIFFKYQHGKWRPYTRINGKNVYLSQKREDARIAGLLERKLICRSLQQIDRNIALLKQAQGQFTDFDKLLPAEVGKQMQQH